MSNCSVEDLIYSAFKAIQQHNIQHEALTESLEEIERHTVENRPDADMKDAFEIPKVMGCLQDIEETTKENTKMI